MGMMFRVVRDAEARQLVDDDDAFDVVERGFASVARGSAIMFPPLAARGSDPITRFGAKAGVDVEARLPGIKIGSYWPGNRSRGLPSHGSTTLMLDDKTGLPTALVAATHLNALRTAAADAVAVHHLASKDARRIAMIGAGNQAWFDLVAIRRVRSIEEVYVWSRRAADAASFAERVRATGLAAWTGDLPAVVGAADIVVTATAAREPLVHAEWVRPGAHISAMGADGIGKQELDPALVALAHRYADLPAQSITIGECQHAYKAGLIAASSIVAIGDVVRGASSRPDDPDAITLFDSSGIAIQDLAMAKLVVDRAASAGLGVTIEM
jgi:ornithine cyclodeaminase